MCCQRVVGPKHEDKRKRGVVAVLYCLQSTLYDNKLNANSFFYHKSLCRCHSVITGSRTWQERWGLTTGGKSCMTSVDRYRTYQVNRLKRTLQDHEISFLVKQKKEAKISLRYFWVFKMEMKTYLVSSTTIYCRRSEMYYFTSQFTLYVSAF